jgi:hypothetical protein
VKPVQEGGAEEVLHRTRSTSVRLYDSHLLAHSLVTVPRSFMSNSFKASHEMRGIPEVYNSKRRAVKAAIRSTRSDLNNWR